MDKLLTMQWNEAPNAYKMYSRINEKRETRIKDIIVQSRYSNKCVDWNPSKKFNEKEYNISLIAENIFLKLTIIPFGQTSSPNLR